MQVLRARMMFCVRLAPPRRDDRNRSPSTESSRVYVCRRTVCARENPHVLFSVTAERRLGFSRVAFCFFRKRNHSISNHRLFYRFSPFCNSAYSVCGGETSRNIRVTFPIFENTPCSPYTDTRTLCDIVFETQCTENERLYSRAVSFSPSP